MIYTERRPKLIKAFYIDSKEAEDFGVQNIPSYMSGYCQVCGKDIKEHKTYQNQVICPDSYLIVERSNVINVMSKENFEEIYKPICEEEL